MRTRTRIIQSLLAGPLRSPTDWVLLHLAPGAAERRFHRDVNVETVRFIESVLSDGDSAVDVGAHTGAILRELVRISPSGAHQAIEPLPSLALGLRSEFPTVQVHECILGSEAFVDSGGGVGTINHNIDDPGFSSVQREGHPRLRRSRTEVLGVASKTLDAICAGRAGVVLIKIDVEGFEVEVLRGAMTTLRDIRPTLILEHERVTEDDADSDELFELLSLAGYNISRLSDWRSPIRLSLGDFKRCTRDVNSYMFVAWPGTEL